MEPVTDYPTDNATRRAEIDASIEKLEHEPLVLDADVEYVDRKLRELYAERRKITGADQRGG